MPCILVIESNTLVRTLISNLLTNSGHEVLAAENGKIGLRKCSDNLDLFKMAKLLGASHVFIKLLNVYDLIWVVNHLQKLKKTERYESNTC